jgi:hypothetical protein
MIGSGVAEGVTPWKRSRTMSACMRVVSLIAAVAVEAVTTREAKVRAGRGFAELMG